MSTQTTQTTSQTRSPKTVAANGHRRKLTVRKIDLAGSRVGFSFKGKFVGLVQGQPFKFTSEDGEILEKTLTNAIFEDEHGDRFSVIADKGLQNCLAEALVKEGTWIEVIKLEKVKLSRGRTMNQYDIFEV